MELESQNEKPPDKGGRETIPEGPEYKEKPPCRGRKDQVFWSGSRNCKTENQNHRLSRWYAPRLQGVNACSVSRRIEKFANRGFFSGRR